MAEAVEKVSLEQEEAEAFLDAGDGDNVPDVEENATSPDEKEALSVTETDLMPLNGEDFSNFCLQSELFKAEDNNKASVADEDSFHLSENEKRALEELKNLVLDALSKHEFGGDSRILLTPKDDTANLESREAENAGISEGLQEEDGAKTLEAIEETIVASNLAAGEDSLSTQKYPESVSIWGVKLLEDEKSDVILLKFLRARDFKVKEAFTMIKNTLKWRKDFGIDKLVEENLGIELEKVVFMHGHSKEGNPVCYNVYGEFQDKELYQKIFSEEESRRKFLRWRIQFLEKSIRKLDFSPGGMSTIVQVNDLKNSPGPNRWELREATNQALHLLQDNYPEFVAKQIFVNVPWWYMALSKMISPFLTQRTKNKFVVAGPSRSTETLLKYISAEQIPVEYGGLNEGEFEASNSATEIILKPSAKHTIEFSVNEACVVSWEVRVVGWEASYGAEFVPNAENAYTVIIQKTRKLGSSDVMQLVCDSYRVGEPGKVVIVLHNLNSKKKILVYRFKSTSLVI